MKNIVKIYKTIYSSTKGKSVKIKLIPLNK